MGSLYVETRPAGAVARAQDAGPIPPARQQNGDLILKNIVVLIPSEVIAAYVALSSLLNEAAFAAGGVVVRSVDVVFIVLLLVCFLLRAHASLPPDFAETIYTKAYWTAVNWPLVVVSCVAYVIWCFAVNANGPFGLAGQQMASILAAAFGLVAPLLVPARPVAA